MDITITKRRDAAGYWGLTDLLGRSMGSIVEKPVGRFTIAPAGNAIRTMGEIGKEPCTSLDDALAKIETHTRGVCRLAPEPDGERA